MIYNIQNNFSYHAPKPSNVATATALRALAKDLAALVLDNCPEGRERSLALTKIEESLMWANASLDRYDGEGKPVQGYVPTQPREGKPIPYTLTTRRPPYPHFENQAVGEIAVNKCRKCGRIPTAMVSPQGSELDALVYMQCAKCGAGTPPLETMTKAAKRWNAQNPEKNSEDDSDCIAQYFDGVPSKRCDTCGHFPEPRCTLENDNREHRVYMHCPSCGRETRPEQGLEKAAERWNAQNLED